MNPIRILIVDDQCDFRKILHEFLTHLPNVVVIGEARDGVEAVDMAERLAPDVVLMDISMPRQNGLEATRIIKNRWPAIKVFIATMSDNPIYRLQAKEAKADGFMVKSSIKQSLEMTFGSKWTASSLVAK